MKMSKETILSMLINIIYIIPVCQNVVALWTWLQNLRTLSLLDWLIYFWVILIKPVMGGKISLFLRLSYIFTTTLICVWMLALVKCVKHGSNLLFIIMYLFIGVYCANVTLISSPQRQKAQGNLENLESFNASIWIHLDLSLFCFHTNIRVHLDLSLFCFHTNVWVHLDLSLFCFHTNVWVHLDLSLFCFHTNVWVHLDLSLFCFHTNVWVHLDLSLFCFHTNIWVHLDLSCVCVFVSQTLLTNCLQWRSISAYPAFHASPSAIMMPRKYWGSVAFDPSLNTCCVTYLKSVFQIYRDQPSFD